jgi:uncharacterized protein YggE
MRRTAAIFVFAVFVFPCCCSLAFAQLDSNSITVSASNNATLQPDQAVFSVTVQSGFSTGFDDVLAALQGSGITSANFSGVSTNGVVDILGSAPGGQLPPPMLTWSFSLPVPLTNTKATVASLTTLQQNITKANNGLTLSFSIIGTQVSQQLAQSQTCSLPSLVAAATTQAQALAAAGGVNLGTILALSSSISNVVTNSQTEFSGAFISTLISSVPPPCAITVKFNVTRN